MMTDAREDARQQYSKTRAEFEKLGTQDKTAFVLEATFATIGQAVEDAGRQFADLFERAANYEPRRREPEAPNPAEPPSATKRAPAKPKDDDS